MAAPDRVYRFFTNLLSKEYSLTEQNPLVIRGAKPLRAYVTPNTSYSSQLDELKQKFKIDGILWLKNPNTPSVPHSDQTDEDNPDTVSITDPSSPTQTITIADPDMNDPDRDAFIAYVWAPAGEGGTDISSNYKFHDIRGWDGEGIQGNSNATDYSTRSWSRASKLRYKEYNVNGTAVILNDAGLNRRGDCAISSISKYIYAESNTEKPRFNDIQVISNFYGTPYNRLLHNCLEMQAGTNGFYEVADYGAIGAFGASMSPSSAFTVKFVGRKKPTGTESTPVYEISYPNNSNFPAITVNGTSAVAEGFSVSVPQYSFRLKTTNEEGTIYSSVISGIDLGLYRWNKDDDYSYGTMAIDSDTDRVALSHQNSRPPVGYVHLEPEKSVERYNQKKCATTNQIDPSEPYVSVDGLVDPEPDTTPPISVLLLYTKTNTFLYTGDPQGHGGVSMNDIQFFKDEADSDGQLVYYPLLPGLYNFSQAALDNANIGWASYITMRCSFKTSEQGEAKEGVYCIEYKMYPNESGPGRNDQMRPMISRYWELEYNGSAWLWPKSEYNKNVNMSIIYADPSDTSGIPRGTDLLTLNTVYGISLLISNIDEGQQISHISISTATKSVALLTDSSGSEAGTTSAGVQTIDIIDPQVSTGKVGWLLRNIGYIKRTDSTITTQSVVTITITYKTYAGMWYGDSGTNKDLPIDKKTIGYRNNISGILYFNYKSKYTTYTDGDHVNPNTIYADALVSGHQPTALNQGNDVLFYIGSGVDSTSGVLYTDDTTSSIVSQGYYFNNYQPSSNVSDGIYYVDALGFVSRVYGS